MDVNEKMAALEAENRALRAVTTAMSSPAGTHRSIAGTRDGLSRRDLLRTFALTSGAAVAGGLTVGLATSAAAVATSGSTSQPAATTFSLLPSYDVGMIGDSISVQDLMPGLSGETSSGMAVFGPASFIGWALPRTAGRFRYRGRWATGGFTSAEVLQTHLPSALASRAAVVTVLCGTNDISLQVPLTETQANITSMVSQLQANGQLPLLSTLPPFNGISAPELAQQTTLNSWLRQYATQQGLPLADYHLVLTDPATGDYYDGYALADGTHPSSSGAYVMGTALAAALNSIPGTTPSELLTAYTPTAMLKDVLISGPQGTNAATWTVGGQATGGGLTETTGTSWVGHKGVITRGTAGDYYLIGAIATPIPGDEIVMSFILDASAVPTGGTWSAVLADLATDQVICGYYAMDNVLPNGISTWQFTIPANINPAHNYAFMYFVQNTPGTVLGCAQVSIRDLGTATTISPTPTPTTSTPTPTPTATSPKPSVIPTPTPTATSPKPSITPTPTPTPTPSKTSGSPTPTPTPTPTVC